MTAQVSVSAVLVGGGGACWAAQRPGVTSIPRGFAAHLGLAKDLIGLLYNYSYLDVFQVVNSMSTPQSPVLFQTVLFNPQKKEWVVPP